MIRKPKATEIKNLLERMNADHANTAEIVQEAAEMLNSMALHYERPSRVIRRSGAFLCPACNKRAKPTHSYCHVCGKRLWWD